MKQKLTLWDIPSIRPSSGTLKYYNYFANGIKLKSKEVILEAIELKIRNIIRIEKSNNEKAKFNYKKMDFEEETQ